LRVTGHCNQGGRKYMEDVFSVAYQQTEDEMDLEYAFFGIFDGHGGKEAAVFAKEHLMDNITKQPNFWSEDDDLVLKAIREGFLATQQAMWADLENWTKTATGLPSTAGTTASIAFIRRGKIFVGHVGDSGIVLGEQDEKNPLIWRASRLTKDHKPEDEKELARIEAAGGKVVNKSGVPRVVWNRPRVGPKGPVRQTRFTPVDEIPFLAVGRALGDLWSYNSKKDVFVVSPEPDLHVYPIDINTNRCLILGTDGCWNVLSPEITVSAVGQAEKNNEKHMIDPQGGHTWVNPSKKLVDMGVERWKQCKLRADNTSVVVVMLDPPGPPRAQVLRRQREQSHGNVTKKLPCNNAGAPPLPPKPKSAKGLAIISRFPNSKRDEEKNGKNLVKPKNEEVEDDKAVKDPGMSRIVHDSMKTEPHKVRVAPVAATETSPSRPATTEVQPIVSTSPLPLQENQAPSSTSKPSTSKLKTGQRPEVSSASSTSTSNSAPVQVNQVSTSDDEGESSSSSKYVTRVPSEVHNAPSATRKESGAARKSLSRELASLQLDSPAGATRGAKPRRSETGRKSATGIPAVRRRGRSINPAAIGNDAGSDAENQEQMVPASKLIEMEKKCAALNNKIKSMEKRVADKTEALSAEVQMLKSSLNTEPLTATTTPNIRALRSRNGGEPTTPPSGTKRKRDVPEGAAPSKKPTRERTLTCPGPPGRNLPSRQTRRSVGSVPVGVKLRRNKLNLLKK